MFPIHFFDLATLSSASMLLLAGLIGVVYFAVKRGRKLSLVGIVLKVLIIVCLCIVLARPYLESVTETSRAVLLLDISESMDEGVADKLFADVKDFNAAGIAVDVIPFSGSTAVVSTNAKDAGSYRTVKNAWSKLDIGSTNLEQALHRVTTEAQSSVLLISDGYETGGNLENALATLKTNASKIFPLVPPNMTGPSAVFRVSNLHAPLVAPTQKSVDVRISVSNATKAVQAGTLEVFHDGKSIFTKTVRAEPDQEVLFVAQSDPSTEGIKEITAKLTPTDKNLPPSSQTIYLSGAEREKILLVSGNATDERILKQILQGQSYRLKALIGAGKDSAPLEFSKYSVVIFNNLPFKQLPRAALNALEQFVKSGGSFMMLGGNKSFGLGGYLKTVMEDILPVTLLPPQTLKKRVNVAVELVLDKSRSMSFGNKIDYAKDAAQEVIRNLKDEDFIGVIGFDTTPFIAIPIMQLKNQRELALSRVGRIFPAGKTNLFPAMDEARRSLAKVKAGRKHMIVLTDGKIPDAGPYYLELVRQMRLLGITVSTVMMGREASVGFLRNLADLGGGAFYQTTNARNLPRIFLSDIKVSTGERTLKEKQEYAVQAGTDPITSTEARSFPPLRGYVQTKRKKAAQTELVAVAMGRAEPLLASWPYGKGKTLAFTSDANGRWSSYWIKWEKFRSFWVDLVDAMRPESEALRDDIKFELRYFVEHGTLTLDLAVYSESVSGSLEALVKLPDGSEKTIDFTGLSRGHYQAAVEQVIAGKYELQARLGDKPLTPVAFYLSGELFGEKKGRGFNMPVLESLAGISGGKVNPSADDVRSQVYRNVEQQDISYIFLCLALILLCVEIFRREVLARYGFKDYFASLYKKRARIGP
ncbi:VWA domain-containing protein [Oligoflexia bacterium]|nr:VWA domain-containing protein [Oligoflexia bacterium]